MPKARPSIILIGYRATGKTTVGRLLAQQLGFSFIDTDQTIEEEEGSCINDMVAQHGWSFFRKKEKDMLKRLAHKKNHVIATGGGAILHKDIWPEIKQNNLVIWFKADIDTICQRLAADRNVSQSQRPSLTGSDIQAEITSVLNKRRPLYKASCHLSLDASDSVEDIVKKALQAIHQK